MSENILSPEEFGRINAVIEYYDQNYIPHAQATDALGFRALVNKFGHPQCHAETHPAIDSITAEEAETIYRLIGYGYQKDYLDGFHRSMENLHLNIRSVERAFQDNHLHQYTQGWREACRTVGASTTDAFVRQAAHYEGGPRASLTRFLQDVETLLNLKDQRSDTFYLDGNVRQKMRQLHCLLERQRAVADEFVKMIREDMLPPYSAAIRRIQSREAAPRPLAALN